MSDDKVFVSGMFIKNKPEDTPDWVKEKISLKLDEFGAWVAEQKKADPDLEWINIDIKESQNGKLYAERDMWKPKPKQEALKPDANFKSDDIPWN
jgi:hypothetical protein